MRILLVNDDGIESPGLWELQRALPQTAETVVVAPATEQSGKGAGISFPQPVHAKRREEAPCEAWSVEGTPVDCVRFALRKILPAAPDLIVSGINPGSNAGTFVFISGTVGGVIEGALQGIPGIAFSSASMTDPQFPRFARYVAPIVQYATEAHPIPPGTLLNVTFPHAHTLDTHHNGKVAGVKFTRQGRSHAHAANDTEGDAYWIQQGYITITPVYVGELTHRTYLERAQRIPFEHA